MIKVGVQGAFNSDSTEAKIETAEYARSPWLRECSDKTEGTYLRANVPDAR